MFWRVASGSISSPVVAILEKDDFSLAHLLEEDELVQEIKAPNQRLLDFLVQESTLKELVHYIVDAPNTSLEGEAQYKLPYAACEVLCCESEELMEAVAAKPALFKILFSGTDLHHPSDSVMTSFFARVIATLLSARSADLINWLKSNREALEGLTDRLETTGVAETLVRLVGADEQMTSSLPMQQLSWISNTAVLPKLLLKLESNEEFNVAENAAEVLTAIARARKSPLTRALGSPANLQRLVARAVDAPRSQALVQALNVCIALVERRRLWEVAHQNGICSLPIEADRALEAKAVDSLAPHTSHLLAYLSDDQSDATQETPYGLLQPPLGFARLTVIALLAALLKTGLPAAEESIMRAKLLQFCLTLFLSYPFNSIVHHQIASIIGGVLENGSDALLAHLLDDCDLLSWLTTAPMEVNPIPRHGDTRSRKRAPLQAGYTGHLTLIGNKLAMTAESRPIVAEHLDRHERWKDFAAVRLAKANQLEDPNAWECGRPVLINQHPSDTFDSQYPESDPHDEHLSAFEPQARRFESAFELDSDSDEGSPTRADQLFAEVADNEDSYFGNTSPPGSLSSLANNLSNLSSSPRWGAKDPSKLFSQPARTLDKDEVDSLSEELSRDSFSLNTSSSPPGAWVEDLDTVDVAPHLGSSSRHGGIGSKVNAAMNGLLGRGREQLEAPSTWEDLIDDAEEHLPPHSSARQSPQWASISKSVKDGLPGEPSTSTTGFSPPTVSSPPSIGESPLHAALCASILTEQLRADGGMPSRGIGESPQRRRKLKTVGHTKELRGFEATCGSGSASPAPGVIDLAELRQPGGTAEAKATPSSPEGREEQPAAVTSLLDAISPRRKSKDLDAHPLSHSNSIDQEDLLPTDSDRAELDAAQTESLPVPLLVAQKSGRPTDGEEQTLVGSFTKLDLSPDGQPPQPLLHAKQAQNPQT